MNVDKKNTARAARKKVRRYIEDRKTRERLTVSYPAKRPINLKGELLEAICPHGMDVLLWKNATYYITHSIFTEQNQDGYIVKETMYVPLSSKILRTVIGSYRIVLDRLIESNIIECDNKYITGVKSRGYRLTKKYRRQGYEFKQITHKTIVEGMRRRNIELLDEQKLKLLPLAHLVRWVLDKRLQINKEEALLYLEDDFKKRMERQLKKRRLKPEYDEKAIGYMVSNRYESAVCNVNNFDDVKLIVDNAGGRLYTNITTMMSPLRNFLTFDGEELVNIDLKNSQPLHFLVMREMNFWISTGKKTDLTLKNLSRDVYEYLQESTSNRSLYIMLQKTRETLRRQGFQDVYKTLVFAGKLYEFKLLKFKGELVVNGFDRFDTRAKAKRECLKLMYFDNTKRYSPSQQSFELFRKYFPYEALIMEKLKNRNYTDFPVLLQKIEAHIVLNIVCQQIFEYDHSIPLFTVHDSIITTKPHARTVIEVIERVYKDILGDVPKLGVDELNMFNAWENGNKYVSDKIDQARLEYLDEIEPEENTNVRKLKPRRRKTGKTLEEEVEALISDDKEMRIDADTLALCGIIYPFEFDLPVETDHRTARKLKK